MIMFGGGTTLPGDAARRAGFRRRADAARGRAQRRSGGALRPDHDSASAVMRRQRRTGRRTWSCQQRPPSTQQLIADGGLRLVEPGKRASRQRAGLTRGIVGLVNKAIRASRRLGPLRAWGWGASRGWIIWNRKDVDAKKVGIEACRATARQP